MELEIGAIERHELATAVGLIDEGTLSPGVEHEERLDDYWEAVLETRRRGGDVVVARRANDVVAMCQIIIFRHVQHTAGWCCEIESVYVRSDQRGRGVGAALLAHCEAFARERRCYRVQLTSRNERLDAHRFYLANGYGQTSQGFKKSLVE